MPEAGQLHGISIGELVHQNSRLCMRKVQSHINWFQTCDTFRQALTAVKCFFRKHLVKLYEGLHYSINLWLHVHVSMSADMVCSPWKKGDIAIFLIYEKRLPSQTSTAHQQKNCRQRRYLMRFIIHLNNAVLTGLHCGAKSPLQVSSGKILLQDSAKSHLSSNPRDCQLHITQKIPYLNHNSPGHLWVSKRLSRYKPYPLESDGSLFSRKQPQMDGRTKQPD